MMRGGGDILAESCRRMHSTSRVHAITENWDHPSKGLCQIF
jgi:hypothetical protein